MLPDLPHDVLCRLLERLDAGSVATLAQTCKALRIFSQEEPLWMAIALKNGNARITWKGSWLRSAAFIVKYLIPFSNSQKENVEEMSRIVLYRRWYRSNLDVSEFLPERPDLHPNARESSRVMNPDIFADHYVRHAQPVLLSEIPEFEPVMKWGVTRLVERYGDVWFSVWHSLKGTFEMQLSNYLEYSMGQRDEDPAYLFDAEIAEKTPDLVQDYSLPEIFSNDLMPLMGRETERPNYRWILIGPARSGSSWHLDPWGSSAWNLLISGKKRWALYPPGTVPPGVQLVLNPVSDDIDYHCGTALQWFLEVLPHLSESERPIEFVQNPGETVFIPHGWWHCVLNLDMTVSVRKDYWKALMGCMKDAVQLLSQGSCRYYSGIYPAQNPQRLPPQILPKLHLKWVGSLVRAAWKHYPHLREELWEWGEMWMYSRELFECLEEICSQHALPPPAKNDTFPFLATSNLLFRVHDYTIKLILHKNPLNLCIQQLAESLALVRIRENWSLEEFLSPSFVGSGVVDVRVSAGMVIEAPYVIMTHCEGQQLSTSFKKSNPKLNQERAEALGTMVARFHQMATPLAQDCRNQNSDACAGKDSLIQMPNLRSALAWVKVEVTADAAFFQAQDPNRVWTSHREQKISLQTTPEDHCLEQLPGHISFSLDGFEAADSGAWGPFVEFLKWRQRVVLHSPSETNLPKHLAKQLSSYLPSDLVSLIPLEDPETLSRPLPVLLHGDLTNDNILVSVDAPEKLCIVDYGDVGYGDPLYDFVSACISSLMCQMAALEAFSRAYWREPAQGRPRRQHSVSYCVMCYALLHEDDTMGWLFEALPGSAEVQTLEELQKTVFGVLDRQGCHEMNHL